MVTRQDALNQVIQYCASGHEEDSVEFAGLIDAGCDPIEVIEVIQDLRETDVEIEELELAVRDLQHLRYQIMANATSRLEKADVA